MKENIDIVAANIHNLISLWREAAGSCAGCYFSDSFSYCHVKNSDWPNKLWFDGKINEKNISAAKNEMHALPVALTIPYWDVNDASARQHFMNAGFKEASVQIGMSLKTGARWDRSLRLSFERVIDGSKAKEWAEIYSRSFGYRISEDILKMSHQTIEFYLAFFESEAVGTAIIYQTDAIVGIHGVGIIPEARRQGFAENIMAFALNRAVDLKSSFITLQASAMGKGLYSRLGFKEDFILQNYILKSNS